MESTREVKLVASEEFDVLGALVDLADPQPKYRAMLESAEAVCPMDGFAVAASRGAADQVLKDAALFSAEGLVNLGNVRPLIPLSVDPPLHVKYRKILDPLFAPKRMDALEDDIAARFNRFVDAFIDRGACDFTNELGVPFPSAIFLGLMGLPWEELDTLLRLKDGILRPGGADADPDTRTEIQAATGQEIYRYFDAILDERQRDPHEDILTLFLQTEIEGERLTR